MSSNNSNTTCGTFMILDGKRVYVETCSLDDCLINFKSDELTKEMRERLESVFPTPASASTSTKADINDSNRKYISVVFDYDYENPHNKEEYTFAGFWNPTTCKYEFGKKQLLNLISKL